MSTTNKEKKPCNCKSNKNEESQTAKIAKSNSTLKTFLFDY